MILSMNTVIAYSIVSLALKITIVLLPFPLSFAFGQMFQKTFIILSHGSMVPIFLEELTVKIINTPKMHEKFSIFITGMLLQNIKLFFVAPILCAILFTGNGCITHHTSLNEAEIIIEQLVPFVTHSRRWNEVKLIEKDSYGRKLFLSISVKGYQSVFYDYTKTEYVYTYIISQKNEDGMVYCYPSYCYQFTSTQQIPNNFKTINDWNTPLRPEKMISFSRDKTQTIHVSGYDKEKIKNALSPLIKTDRTYLTVVYPPKSERLFLVREVLDVEETPTFGKTYLFTLNNEYTLTSYRELQGTPDQWIPIIWQSEE